MTGPQGSGNHLFSKVLGQNNQISGWDSLQDKVWEAHEYEPYAEYWKDPTKLVDLDFTDNFNFFITSISCPYFYDGQETIPDYELFSFYLKLKVKMKYLIIGRDKTILDYQQLRLRKKHTTHVFKDNIDYLLKQEHMFISQELLYLYRLPYLNSIERWIGVNETKDDTLLESMLKTDANKKYINQSENTELDDTIRSLMKGIQRLP